MAERTFQLLFADESNNGETMISKVTEDATVLARWVFELLNHYGMVKFTNEAFQRILTEGFFLLKHKECNKRIIVAFDTKSTNQDDLELSPFQSLIILYHPTVGCINFRVRKNAVVPLFLKSFFMFPFIGFVGMEVWPQTVYLEQNHHLTMQIELDVSDWAFEELNDRYEMSFQQIFEHVLDYTYERPLEIIHGNWCAEDLTNEQIGIATVDCFTLYNLASTYINDQWPAINN